MSRTALARIGTSPRLDVAARCPVEEPSAPDQPRLAVLDDERSVGQAVVRRGVTTLPARRGIDPLAVQLLVHRVGTVLAWMQRAPDLDEAVVVGSATERTRAVSGCERGRLVEEEQLGEAAGLQQRRAMPAAEREPARDPPPDSEPPADVPLVVVQAAAVSVDEAASGIGDEVAEGSDAILSRHGVGTVAPHG